MPKINKRTREKISKYLTKYKRVLGRARERKINEANTVNIIIDMLGELFGYDKYKEITEEEPIKNRSCDLAIKLDGDVKYLIEAKKINTNLKGNHINQAINYAANQGVSWVILTNGIIWQIYKLKFSKGIDHDLVAEFDITKKTRSDKDIEHLYLITKEGVQKNFRDEFYQKMLHVNKFMIGNLILSGPVQNIVRRELRKLDNSIKISTDEILKITETEVLCPDILDSEEGKKAASKVKRHITRSRRKKTTNRLTKN